MKTKFILYKINKLDMKIMNRIDKMQEGRTQIRHSFMGTEMFT